MSYVLRDSDGDYLRSVEGPVVTPVLADALALSLAEAAWLAHSLEGFEVVALERPLPLPPRLLALTIKARAEAKEKTTIDTTELDTIKV